MCPDDRPTVPSDPAQAFTSCLSPSQIVLPELLAFCACVARLFDAAWSRRLDDTGSGLALVAALFLVRCLCDDVRILLCHGKVKTPSGTTAEGSEGEGAEEKMVRFPSDWPGIVQDNLV